MVLVLGKDTEMSKCPSTPTRNRRGTDPCTRLGTLMVPTGSKHMAPTAGTASELVFGP